MSARIRCIRRRCTCKNLLGKHQTEFEMRIGKGEEPIKILEDLNMVYSCCLLNMQYPPTYPVVDSNAGRIMDEMGIIDKEKEAGKKFLYQDGPDLYLSDIPDFPKFT